MTQPRPSFLAAKPARAKASAGPANATHARTSRHDSDETARQAKTDAGTKATAQAMAPRKAGKGAKGKGKSGALEMHSLDAPPPGTSPLGFLRQHAARPEAVDLLETMRPGCVDTAVDAMIIGAGRPGREGVADRTALFKMFGLPWAQPSISATAARALGGALGEALGQATSRLEGDRRHAQVTVGGARTLEAAGDGAFYEVGRVLPEHEDGKKGRRGAQALRAGSQGGAKVGQDGAQSAASPPTAGTPRHPR